MTHQPQEQEDWQPSAQHKAIELAERIVIRYADTTGREDKYRPFVREASIFVLIDALPELIERAKAEERERGKQVVFLILPLAKGYAHQHDVGSNNRYIEIAENYLATPQDI